VHGVNQIVANFSFVFTKFEHLKLY